MIRISRPLQLAAALSLFALAACCPVTKQTAVKEPGMLGNPENPYPLSYKPKVGDIVHLPTGTVVSLQQMMNIATDARVIYVGETHDNPSSHRLELQTLQAVEERYPGKAALGMEMFSRSQQPVLDRWVAGELDEKAFVKASRWYDNWKMDFDYYRDLLVFARDKHIPVIALNADKALVQAVRSRPIEELDAEQKAKLPEFDVSDPYQRAMTESMFAGHTHGKLASEAFLRVQTLWDETMAESAARFLSSPSGKDRHLVVIAGGNHINYGFGIPRRVFRRLPSSYVTIGGNEIVISEGKNPETMDVELPHLPMVPFDFLMFLSYDVLKKDGVMLGVGYQPAPSGRGVVVTEVVPDSNADRAGVKKGDVIVAMDGEPVTDSYDLQYGIKKKHAGDKGTLQVERDGKPLKLDVVYKPSEPGGESKQHGKQKP